jgi:hypothetical protein
VQVAYVVGKGLGCYYNVIDIGSCEIPKRTQVVVYITLHVCDRVNIAYNSNSKELLSAIRDNGNTFLVVRPNAPLVKEGSYVNNNNKLASRYKVRDIFLGG